MTLTDRDYIMQNTPAQIAAAHDHNQLYGMIGYYTNLDMDSLANIIGDNDTANMTAADMADNLDNAWPEWYEDNPAPDYSPADLAADIAIYTAWQIATTV